MRAVVTVVLLLCLAVGAWWVFARSEPEPMPAAPGASAPSDDPAAQPVAATQPQTGPAPAVPEAEARPREAVAPTFAGPSAEVQVVSHATKAPIAGATVTCTPPDLDWQKLAPDLAELATKDQDAFQRRVGLSFTTDAEGRCRVPLGKYGTPVTAVKDALWGQAHLAPEQKEPTVLTLRPDCTLRVLVVDAGGVPAAGALVVGKRKEGDQPDTWHMGRTDGAGRYQQRHIQRYAGNDGSAKLEFAVGVPGGEGPAVTVDVAAPPPDVVLQLPPGGTVTVRVLDAEGQPIDPGFLEPPRVRLATFTERPTSPNAENEGLSRAPQDSMTLDQSGVAVFGSVAFDRFVMAHLSWTLRSAAVPGPTREEPNVELTLREGKDDVVLTGILLDADGRPVASSGYMATCTYRSGMSSQTGRTDGAGRFRVTLAQLRAGTVTVEFDTKFANRSNPLAAELPPRELTKGRNDLGEIRLAAHSILVQGKVVGAAADPPPVQIQVERQRDGRWQQEHNLYPEWGAGGAFTLRSGMAKGTPIRLVVQTNGFLSVDPVECSAGDTGLEIRLRTGGSARATFLVDASLPLERLTLRFRSTDPRAPRDSYAEMMERMYDRLDPQQVKDGRLQREWQGLKPGSYRLQALCAGVAEPLAVVDAVEVGDGPCADPRLVDIDLRGRARTFEVRATGSDGKPIASPEAFVVIRSSGDDWRGFHLGRGFVRIAAPGAVDLIVVAKGHKTAFVNGVSDARTVALEAAGEAHFALSLPSELPEGATLKLHLQPALDLPPRARIQLDNGRSTGADSFFVEEAVVDAAGKVTVPVRYPGACTLEATVALGRGGGTYIRDLEPRKITLPAAGEVAVRVGQKDFETALGRVRR